jgi:hypothetical protein
VLVVLVVLPTRMAQMVLTLCSTQSHLLAVVVVAVQQGTVVTMVLQVVLVVVLDLEM